MAEVIKSMEICMYKLLCLQVTDGQFLLVFVTFGSVVQRLFVTVIYRWKLL